MNMHYFCNKDKAKINQLNKYCCLRSDSLEAEPNLRILVQVI